MSTNTDQCTPSPSGAGSHTRLNQIQIESWEMAFQHRCGDWWWRFLDFRIRKSCFRQSMNPTVFQWGFLGLFEFWKSIFISHWLNLVEIDHFEMWHKYDNDCFEMWCKLLITLECKWMIINGLKKNGQWVPAIQNNLCCNGRYRRIDKKLNMFHGTGSCQPRSINEMVNMFQVDANPSRIHNTHLTWMLWFWVWSATSMFGQLLSKIIVSGWPEHPCCRWFIWPIKYRYFLFWPVSCHKQAKCPGFGYRSSSWLGLFRVLAIPKCFNARKPQFSLAPRAY